MSLRGDKYETAEEVRFRLEKSIVLYDGKPVYINRVSVPDEEGDDQKEVARVYFFELPYSGRGKEIRKYLSSRKFDLTPFRMGYVNLFDECNGAMYASRMPVRQNKQGLSEGNLAFSTVDGERVPMPGFGPMVRSQAFVDMINNVYPSFREASELLADKDKKLSSVAVSRSFVLTTSKDLGLLYLHTKGIACGFALPDEKALRLPEKYKFLRESLEEARIPVT